jgi:hypothetical protein
VTVDQVVDANFAEDAVVALGRIEAIVLSAKKIRWNLPRRRIFALDM